MTRREDQVVDLVRQMIRNRCVNDGSPTSGEEARNANLLESFLAGCFVDHDECERHKRS